MSLYLYRRLAYVLILLCLADYPGIQILLIIYLSLLNLLLTVLVKPNILISDNIMDIVNETLIYVCSVLMIALTDMVDDPYMKYNIGWSMAIVTALVIVFNFGITFIHLLNVIRKGIKRVWERCRNKKLKKQDD